MLDQTRLDQLITQVGAQTYRHRLLPLVRPSIRLMLTAAGSEDDIPLGAMKFGGHPDLPPDLAWPAEDDVALHFVAQLRLDALAPHDPTGLLPESGILYFFQRDSVDFSALYQGWQDTMRGDFNRLMNEAIEENPDVGFWEVGFKYIEHLQQLDWSKMQPSADALPKQIWDFWRSSVLHYEGDLSTLRRADPPDSLPMNLVYQPCTVTIARDLTIPPLFSYEAHTHLGIDWEDDSDDDDPYGPYIDLLAAVEELGDDVYAHRMFGYSDQIQGDVFVEAESIATREEATDDHALYADPTSGITDWLLLLQVDSEDAADFMWGDAGLLYWCIKRDDLRARRFDRAVCTSQST